MSLLLALTGGGGSLDATGTGALQSVSLTSVGGTAAGSAQAVGSLAPASLGSVSGTASGSGVATVAVAPVTLSVVAGSASSSASTTGVGSISAVALGQVQGAATGSGVAAGAVASMSLSSVTGGATGDGVTADVKVSWLQFDTLANPVDVKVSWFQFDTLATPCNVKVSWFQFDTAVKVVETSTGGSAPKLRFTPFFEAHVGVPSHGLRSGSTPVDAEGKEATLASVQSLGCFSGCVGFDVQSAASFEIMGAGTASGGALPEVCASVTALVSGVGSSAGMTSLVASGDADVYVGSYFAGSRANAVDVLAIQNPTDEELIFLMRKMRRVDNSLTC